MNSQALTEQQPETQEHASKKNKLKGQNLRARILTGAIGVPLVAAVILIGYPLFPLSIMLIGWIAAGELNRLVQSPRPYGYIIMVILTLSTILVVGTGQHPLLWLVALLFSLGISIYQIQQVTPGKRWYRWQQNYGLSILFALYLGVPLGICLASREWDDGLKWITFFLASNWLTDIMAFFGGNLFGKTKLAPRISPNKTREGAVIGIGGATIGGFIVSQFLGLPALVSLIGTIVIAVMAIIGDLFESWIKRRFHVKDTGYWIYGHGGLMDRLDSTLLAMPGMYIVLLISGYVPFFLSEF